MKVSKSLIIAIGLSLSFLCILMMAFKNTTSDLSTMYNNIDRGCSKEQFSNSEFCKLSKEERTYDTYTVMRQVLSDYDFQWLSVVAIIFVCLPCLFNFCKTLKSKMELQILTRDNYYKVLRKSYLSCLKYSWVIVVPIIILILCSYAYSGHFNYTYAISTGYTEFYFQLKPIPYLILYFFCLYMFILSFINLGLIVTRKNHNIVIVLIETFLIYLSIDLLIEMAIGYGICVLITGKRYSHFNIVDILYMGHATNIYEMIFIPLTLLILSALVMMLCYKNKEKFIQDIEKNN